MSRSAQPDGIEEVWKAAVWEPMINAQTTPRHTTPYCRPGFGNLLSFDCVGPIACWMPQAKTNEVALDEGLVLFVRSVKRWSKQVAIRVRAHGLPKSPMFMGSKNTMTCALNGEIRWRWVRTKGDSRMSRVTLGFVLNLKRGGVRWIWNVG